MHSLIQKFEKLNWKFFLIGLLMGMAAVLSINSGINVQHIINPLSQKQKNKSVDFKMLTSKLREKENNFSLKQKPENIVPNAYAQDLDIPAFSYIAIDYDTGEIIIEKNSETRLPIASLTKLMTAVVALDLASSNDIFTISQNAANKPPTKIGVVTGQKMTLEELLNAALLTSANDAAQVIKEGINFKYKSHIFERAMNEKAKFLGLKKSSFSNPQGFDNIKNYSTARDFAIFSRYALTNYPLIAEIVGKDYKFLPADLNHKQFDLYNWNGLLDVYPNIFGIKIGNTDDALFTTAVVSQRKSKKVLVVSLGAPGVLERDLWASKLLDVGFEKLANLPKIEVTEDQLIAKYSTWRYWN